MTAIAGVELSNPDKVLYPEQNVTKGDLAEYYVTVADWILPHVADRPITLVRCPTGRQKKCFYQRHAGSGVPEAVGTVAIPGFEEAYLVIRDVRGLVSLVQMGVLEIHPWQARAETPDRPDRIVFDFDPGEDVEFERVIAAAREVRERLRQVGLESVCKTTGGKGLHVVVPIAPDPDWGGVKAFARAVAERMSADAPDRFTSKIAKSIRKGRILVDYLRNDPTSTAVAPYSTRARPGAPVATPVTWEELEDLDPARFDLRTVPERLRGLNADPWADLPRVRQSLTERAKAAFGLKP